MYLEIREKKRSSTHIIILSGGMIYGAVHPEP